MDVEVQVGKLVEVKQQPSAAGTDIREPHPRSRHCCATDGVNLFVYGGYHPEYCEMRTGDVDVEERVTKCQVFTELWCLNLLTETWCKVMTNGDAPVTAASMSMIFDTSGYLLTYGGTSYPMGSTTSKDVFVFKLKDKAWKTLTCTGERPAGKYGTAMALNGDSLYVFGGSRLLGNKYFFGNSELHCLNLKSKSWSLLHDNPEARCRTMYTHGLAWHENKLYVIGSNFKELPSMEYLDKIRVFDLGTGTWDTECTQPCLVGHFPRQRRFHSCVQWENEVYICGGQDGIIVFADIWKLELPSLQWSRIPAEMPVPSFFHSAAITPTKCMYIFGGVSDLDNDLRSNSVFRIWLAIPPLLHLALKRVLSLLPDRNADSIRKLQELGVPSSVIDMLKHIE